jgi:hypothetical protein
MIFFGFGLYNKIIFDEIASFELDIKGLISREEWENIHEYALKSRFSINSFLKGTARPE